MKKLTLLPLIVILFISSFSIAISEEMVPYSIIQAINNLKSGNERYIKGKMSKHDHVTKREDLSKNQEPYAIIVTCSDSRVAPEYIFDAGLGSIFVVRTAGNVVDEVALGSIEYAAEHFHSKLILVLGHESCGAVKASIAGKTESPNINSIIDKIEPCVKKCKTKKIAKDDQVKYVTDENVKEQMNYIVEHSKIVEELMHENKLTIMGGYYNFKSGMVDFVESESKSHGTKEGSKKESKKDTKKETKKEKSHGGH
jgi:carbonic anhydrase